MKAVTGMEARDMVKRNVEGIEKKKGTRDKDAGSANLTNNVDNEAEDGTTFEESLEELEALVDRLERGQLLLDESLELFERGMKLARLCNRKLSKAERKIEMLIEENGKIKVGTFNEDG
jgi:exodeoxyribonuclease VII small subunit